MKIIVAGSRGLDNYDVIYKMIASSRLDVQEIVSGMCERSPDMAGVNYAIGNHMPLTKCPANWRRDGVFDKAAGMNRNQEMANIADGLILVYNGYSSGSCDMMERAIKRGLPIEVNIIPPADNISYRVWRNYGR